MADNPTGKTFKIIFYYPWLVINSLAFFLYLLFSAIITFSPNSLQGVLKINEALLQYMFPIFIVYVFICAFTLGISELVRWIKRRHQEVENVAENKEFSGSGTNITPLVLSVVIASLIIGWILIKRDKKNAKTSK